MFIKKQNLIMFCQKFYVKCYLLSSKFSGKKLAKKEEIILEPKLNKILQDGFLLNDQMFVHL